MPGAPWQRAARETCHGCPRPGVPTPREGVRTPTAGQALDFTEQAKAECVDGCTGERRETTARLEAGRRIEPKKPRVLLPWAHALGATPSRAHPDRGRGDPAAAQRRLRATRGPTAQTPCAVGDPPWHERGTQSHAAKQAKAN